jgi:molecular chaperone DnaK (HSP70)
MTEKKKRTGAEKKETQREVYSQSNELIELLSFLTAKIDKFDGKAPEGLCDKVMNLCWELGTNLACFSEDLEKKTDEDTVNPYA